MAEQYDFSDEFQKKILALIARDKGTFIAYKEVVKPMYFRKSIHIDLCRIIHEHYDKETSRASIKKTPINPPTLEVLWEEVRKLCSNNKNKENIKDQYNECILDMYEASLGDAEYIKENLVAFGKRSAIERAILQSVEDIEKHDYSRIEERIRTALSVGDHIEDNGVDYWGDAENRIVRYSSGTDGVRRIPTGLSGIDKVMHGGLGNGELGVIIAPPNRGKSFGLINIGAGAVSEGYNVAHFSLEMPEAQVTKRYDERLLHKDFDYLKSNSNKVLLALQNMQKLNHGKLKIKRFPARSCNINSIRAQLTRWAIDDGFVPDEIIIDYGDIVQPLRNYTDKRFETESVYLDMRDLAIEYDCPVWTASQTNRDGLNKKIVTIADLAEAFNKANHADAMLALCQTDEEKEDGVMRWHVAKQRDGKAGITIDGYIDYDTSTMEAYDSN